MSFLNIKTSFLLTIIFCSIINISVEYEVNNNQINKFIYNNKHSNNNLRELWDDSVKYNANARADKEERDSINNHCKKSAYKYFIYYVDGQTYEFTQFINRDNAVRFEIFIIYLIYSGHLSIY